MSGINGCTDPDCIACQWVGEAIMRFNDRLKAAILVAAADLPPITVRRWLPGDPEDRS